MASKVPKFGAWDGQGGENFTVFFDNARKTKTNGQKINPNDPEENPDMFRQNVGPQSQPTTSPNRADKPVKQTKVPQFGAWDNGGNAGYTACFDNARKTKVTGPAMPDNEPQLNRDMPTRTNPAATQTQSQAQAQAQDRTPVVKYKVPQFGNWENEGGAGYTAQFDHLKKKKNDPGYKEESSNAPQPNRDVASLPQEGRAKVPQFGDWNGGQAPQYTAYFENARKTKNAPPAKPAEPQLNRDVGDKPRPNPRDQGSNNSVPSSEAPLHQRRQQPAQPKPKIQPRNNAGRGNPTAGIPQFGGWNNDPSQADGYTTAFTRAKEERKTPIHANAPPSYHQQPLYNNHQQQPKGCCSIL